MPMQNHEKLYDADFFQTLAIESLPSAKVIAKIACDLFQPRSVIDLGCGVGAWLAAFQELGLKDILGIDGDYVNPERLLIDRANFRAIDLARPFQISEKFDLAVCVEVAEHLPARCSKQLVQALTRAAPLVLFSAAIPGQGGVGHVNEQWPDYWRTLFAAEGFTMFDPIRPRIRDNQAISWWFRQNVVIFASRQAVKKFDTLAAEADAESIEWIHISAVRNALQRNRRFRDRLLSLPGAIHIWKVVRPWIRRNYTHK